MEQCVPWQCEVNARTQACLCDHIAMWNECTERNGTQKGPAENRDIHGISLPALDSSPDHASQLSGRYKDTFGMKASHWHHLITITTFQTLYLLVAF